MTDTVVVVKTNNLTGKETRYEGEVLGKAASGLILHVAWAEDAMWMPAPSTGERLSSSWADYHLEAED